jgi:hypothetical protein
MGELKEENNRNWYLVYGIVIAFLLIQIVIYYQLTITFQ